MRKPLDTLYNFHWIVPGEAARSSQAYLSQLDRFLLRHRIKALINLRGRHPKFGWWKYETAVCQAHDIAHFDVMLDSRRLPLKDMLAALFDAFDAAPRPFLLKCAAGQDRTSFASALYILYRDGWGAMATARRQLAKFPYLHFPSHNQTWLGHFLRYAEEQADGRPIADWARQSYDPEALAAWLHANALGDAFNGIFEPWKPRVRK